MACFDLVVIGGGAAGLSAAVCAAEEGDDVLVLEAGPAVGRKILASGNGRCNLMNTGELRYYGDSAFAANVMEQFPAVSQREFWRHLGLFLTEEKEGRVYPCTFQASSVLLALKNRLLQYGVVICLQSPVLELGKDQNEFRIRTGRESYQAKRVLLATGGPAHGRLGGNESGKCLLEPFGIGSVPFRPALAPLITDRKDISGLSGIRAKCGVSLMDPEGRLLHREEGEVLFTDYGVSGICVMQCARFVNGEGNFLELDFAGDLFPDQESLKRELLDRKKRFSSLAPENLLNGILVPKLSYAVLKQAGFPLRGEILESVSDRAVFAAAEKIRHYLVRVVGTKGLEDAQVSAGGIGCGEFDPRTMEHRKIRGLHAAGELMNVDGDCGGFNLMFAFASGILAGLNGRRPSFETGGCQK